MVVSEIGVGGRLSFGAGGVGSNLLLGATPSLEADGCSAINTALSIKFRDRICKKRCGTL
jgi:hypothetical protein